MPLNSEFVSIVLCQVIMFFVFITIFFFTYATLTEKNVLKNQISFLIDQTIGPYLNFLSKNEPSIDIKSEVNKITPDPKNDSEIDAKNKAIIIYVIKILIISVLVISGLIYGLYHFSKVKNSGFFTSFKLTHIIIESLIILFFVGITEFVFLKYFGARFISIDINKVKIALLTKIKNYIGNK